MAEAGSEREGVRRHVASGEDWRGREEPLPEAGCHHHNERRQQDGEHADRALADRLRAAEVPCRAAEDDGELPQRAAIPEGKAGRDAREIEDEDDGVDGHVENAGGEREPSLLKSPETAEGAADPAVVATLFGQGGG